MKQHLKNYLKQVLDKVHEKGNKSLEFSLGDVHARGLFSLVIDGKEHGKLTRIFIADKKLKPFTVQYHTHRYPIRLTTLKGDIMHHTAEIVNHPSEVTYPTDLLKIDEFAYRSPINGGDGLAFVKQSTVMPKDYRLPIGSQIDLGVHDFHTVSCSKNSIWIVEEQGFEIEESRVLGVPFTLDNLYNKPAQFQINDKCQQVSREIKKILLNYSLV
jgi:hypothetical protein